MDRTCSRGGLDAIASRGEPHPDPIDFTLGRERPTSASTADAFVATAAGVPTATAVRRVDVRVHANAVAERYGTLHVQRTTKIGRERYVDVVCGIRSIDAIVSNYVVDVGGEGPSVVDVGRLGHIERRRGYVHSIDASDGVYDYLRGVDAPGVQFARVRSDHANLGETGQAAIHRRTQHEDK
jgi:hypothetical protein